MGERICRGACFYILDRRVGAAIGKCRVAICTRDRLRRAGYPDTIIEKVCPFSCPTGDAFLVRNVVLDVVCFHWLDGKCGFCPAARPGVSGPFLGSLDGTRFGFARVYGCMESHVEQQQQQDNKFGHHFDRFQCGHWGTRDSRCLGWTDSTTLGTGSYCLGRGRIRHGDNGGSVVLPTNPSGTMDCITEAREGSS